MRLISEARDLLAQKDYALAVDRLETVLDKAPGNAQALEVLQGIRETLELARQSEIDRLLASAESSFEAGANAVTETIATQIFALDPENQAALKLLERSYGDGMPGDAFEYQTPEATADLDDDNGLIERIDLLLSRPALSAVAARDRDLAVGDQQTVPDEHLAEPLTRIDSQDSRPIVESPRLDLGSTEAVSMRASVTDSRRPRSRSRMDQGPNGQSNAATRAVDQAEGLESSLLQAVEVTVGIGEVPSQSSQSLVIAEPAPETVGWEQPVSPHSEDTASGVELSPGALSSKPARRTWWSAVVTMAVLAAVTGSFVANCPTEPPTLKPATAKSNSPEEKLLKGRESELSALQPDEKLSMIEATGGRGNDPGSVPDLSQEPLAEGDLPSSAVVPGLLSVRWQPPAKVRVKGREEKITPCSFDLPPGSYTIELSHSGFPTETRTVTIGAGQTQWLVGEFLPDGQLSVNAAPWAKVVVDGMERGLTPLRLGLRPGSYEVLLQHPEYGEERYLVQIKSGIMEKIAHNY